MGTSWKLASADSVKHSGNRKRDRQVVVAHTGRVQNYSSDVQRGNGIKEDVVNPSVLTEHVFMTTNSKHKAWKPPGYVYAFVMLIFDVHRYEHV